MAVAIWYLVLRAAVSILIDAEMRDGEARVSEKEGDKMFWISFVCAFNSAVYPSSDNAADADEEDEEEEEEEGEEEGDKSATSFSCGSTPLNENPCTASPALIS